VIGVAKENLETLYKPVVDSSRRYDNGGDEAALIDWAADGSEGGE